MPVENQLLSDQNLVTYTQNQDSSLRNHHFFSADSWGDDYLYMINTICTNIYHFLCLSFWTVMHFVALEDWGVYQSAVPLGGCCSLMLSDRLISRKFQTNSDGDATQECRLRISSVSRHQHSGDTVEGRNTCCLPASGCLAVSVLNSSRRLEAQMWSPIQNL